MKEHDMEQSTTTIMIDGKECRLTNNYGTVVIEYRYYPENGEDWYWETLQRIKL